MKVVYTGELSSVVPPGMSRDVKRGEVFLAPDEWGKPLILSDPDRWRVATDEESKALDAKLAAEQAAREEAQRIADEQSLAVAMEEDAKLRAIEEPATGGGGSGGETIDGADVVVFDVPMTEAAPDITTEVVEPAPETRRSKKKTEE